MRKFIFKFKQAWNKLLYKSMFKNKALVLLNPGEEASENK